MMDSWVLVEKIIQKNDPKLERFLDKKVFIPKTSAELVDPTLQHVEFCSKIDPSYLEHFLKLSRKEEFPSLKQVLLSPEPSTLKQFLTQEVLSAAQAEYELLPYSYFPFFENQELLKLDFNQMKKLTLLLGLYDLKTTLRVIIDQKTLKTIAVLLPSYQKKFLEKIEKQTDRIEFKKLPLETWDQTLDSLSHLLYLRGINRLAKGFALEPEYVKNEIVLRLLPKDKVNFKALSTSLDMGLIHVLRNQIGEAIEFIQEAS